MKTLKWLGIIAFAFLAMNIIVKQEHQEEKEALQEYTQEDQFKVAYGKPAPETVYVKEKPAEPEPQPKQKVEVVYYDPDYPDILYKAEDIHQCEWLFPTGQSRDAYPPGSQLEREWIQNQQSKKRYKPDYIIEPVEGSH